MAIALQIPVGGRASNFKAVLDDRKFQAAIAKMMSLRKVNQSKVVRNIGRDYARAAAKMTPVAKKVGFEQLKAKDGHTYWVPLKKLKFPRGKGFARLGWFKALTSLGVKMGSPNPRIKAGPLFGIFQSKEQDTQSSVTIGNKVPYIVTIDNKYNFDGAAKAHAMYILQRSIKKYELKLGGA